MELKTLVPDIYDLVGKLEGERSITEEIEPHVDEFCKNIREALIHWSILQDQTRKDGLRMSNIGQKDRRLWMGMHKEIPEGETEHPSKFIKFLYGHLLEQVMLLLVKASGHEVTGEQGEVNVFGIKGHMDFIIDGEVVDGKTASNFAFKKFVDGKLADDDPFGYLTQLAGYEHSNGTNEGGFLVMNKENGRLCLHIPDEMDKPNIEERVKKAKELQTLEIAPEPCNLPVPKGEGGNMTIHRMCGWCPYKFECHKDSNDGAGLRKFQYRHGVEYFTQVKKLPRVEEIL